MIIIFILEQKVQPGAKLFNDAMDLLNKKDTNKYAKFCTI